MSSPKLNLPMLSPYLLGEVMSSHDGISCYPAIGRGTEDKYIVKVISVPASQSKLDALLLTGAMADKAAALDYFRSLSEDVVHQTQILRSLSHQEGFVPYLDSQIVPMESGTGYEVYLLGTYKHSLERIFRGDPMTHAEVANLGLDLCAALAACRRTGYVYVDLKPGNIFRVPEQGFCIGDVGFIALSSLKYASLPDKYRSSYSAPELADDMSVLNSTVDIYALGLVLYQAYNGGILPFEGAAPAEILPPPIYADYEMARIILKACHPDPQERWQEPTKMAQALIEYLQTYGAPESPIIPPALDMDEEEDQPEEEPFLPEADPQQLQQEMEELENADPDELAFLSGLVNDETAPNEENTADVPDEVMTEELSEIFAQVDELIEHELPAPPVAPEPVFVPMPEPIVLEEEREQTPGEPQAESEAEEAAPMAEEAEAVPPEEAVSPEPVAAEVTEAAPSLPQEDAEERRKFSLEDKPFLRRLIVAAVAVLLLLGAWLLGSRYYNDAYLLNVDGIVLNCQQDTLTVQVLSNADETLLTVICTDSYGNSNSSSVTDGFATFTGLRPNTRYTVRVEARGRHKLANAVSDSFNTPAQIQILSFIAGIGPDDCSVALNFTASGSESDRWSVVYSADGISQQTMDFTGHSVVVSDLVAGALYTFTLVSPDGLYLAGQTQVQFRATKILYAQNLNITACGGGKLTATWEQSPDGEVTQWRVRCFNESGYNVTVTTADLSYTFTELDHSTPCTIEVTAVGMNRSVSTSISADPVTVESFTCSFAPELGLQIHWSYGGKAPAGGWLLRYRLDDGQEQTLALAEAATTIMPISGATYNFTIETAQGNYVFDAQHSFTMEQLPAFTGYGIGAGDLTQMLYVLPEVENPKLDDFAPDGATTQFLPGQKAAFLMFSGQKPEASENQVDIRFFVYDANGELVCCNSAAAVWSQLWQEDVCVLPIPTLPEAEGEYTLCLYFDGMFVCSQAVTILPPVTEEAPPAEEPVI